MTVWLILIVAGYLLGSVPLSYFAARSRGVDLRKHGTRQVGGGNLWRTTSRMLGLAVGLFDFIKGMAMVWIAQSQGLDVAQQLVVGLAVIVGHNWPVFLRFHGGRGVATGLGIIILLPSINKDLTPWITAAFFIIGIAGLIATRRTHIPVLAAMLSLPIVSASLHEPLPVTLGFLAMLLIIIIKRLTAQPIGEGTTISRGRLLLYRLFFDRDIRDRNIWISRQPDKNAPDKAEPK
jgi:glycerol-3-phosphate acyltransferase PlsY